MTDPNGERAERVARVIQGLIKRYCMNPLCPSYGRKRPGVGRYICSTRAGDPADLLCEDCHKVTEIRATEEVTVRGKK